MPPTARPTSRVSSFMLCSSRAHGASVAAQHASDPFCLGGHGTSPCEQNTQQSPLLGRSVSWHSVHS
jgi:hypothetical protein